MLLGLAYVPWDLPIALGVSNMTAGAVLAVCRLTRCIRRWRTSASLWEEANAAIWSPGLVVGRIVSPVVIIAAAVHAMACVWHVVECPAPSGCRHSGWPEMPHAPLTRVSF